MPNLTIDDQGTVQVQAGTRLLNALIDHGIDMLYRCGGYGRCVLCQVAITAGEPPTMTVLEDTRLTQRGLHGTARLACQILIHGDMTVRPLFTWTGSGLSDPGPAPAAQLTPPPQWRPVSIETVVGTAPSCVHHADGRL